MTKIDEALKSLKRNNFDTFYADNKFEAKEWIKSNIEPGATVGVGDSVSVRQVISLEELHDLGRVVINPFSEIISRLTTEKKINSEQRKEMHKKALSCDYFITGTNVLTKDGRLLNVDAGGNRVAGMIFGPGRVIVVIGKNKIVDDLDKAFERMKEVIGPQHAKMKNRNTPCVEIGYCMDCDADDRICNVTTILDKRPTYTDFTVILVNEDLGLGWNREWDEERINKIYLDYKQLTWLK